ncbi:HAMP domain-containing sensor histidine kinase [Luteolibacter sp. SL250]|uniref:sensor histidine kinase n=1 Tax=Luteolibacter sp. SL250 TaxID=2995170 RepID=UPI0022706017|nr:HAMP domain-containing sensor histidine kinase [Luteolibacter sp. SL250]WAC20115.1 HAMP domain-containing sensor histidine kinase [Luteolibacter sp. SL250]
MRNSRTWLVWAAFALCAATILGAMAWQTRNAMASERERIAAVRQADLQEKMRLALWRMDTMGADLLLEEGLGGPAEFIRARLLWKDNGQLTQPDGTPASGELQRAITQPGESFERYFVRVGNASPTWKSIPAGSKAAPDEAMAPAPRSEKAQQIANNLELEQRNRAIDGATMRQKAIIEEIAQAPKMAPAKKKAESRKAAEAELAEAATADAIQAPAEPPPAAEAPASPAPSPDPPAAAPPPTEIMSATKPVWIGDELFLLRSVSGPQRAITGSWMRLDVLQARLLGEIRDLLPAARLLPAKAPSSDGLVLASLPLRLEPGPLDFRSMPDTPAPAVLLSLATGWAAALLAIMAASFLVFGIMRLSERRASFVSAVTHELRTPLTTFRLYSDMLESNAVKPEKRGDYLRVLSREADRLSHLVENVLAFSRIERGSARSAVSSSRAADLLAPMRERFEARLATAGMSLHMPLDESGAAETLRADSTAIEHILFNLVDNAAKYAASGSPATLDISVTRNQGKLEIRVTDHGPGIPPGEHRRIFRAFHKSAREAAESRPGVGLGLALSRRLARGMGGDLTCESTTGKGATFILSLPA